MSALSDASRVAFEVYLRGLPHFPVSPLAWTYQRDTLGNYCNNRVDDMWHGWQASRKQEQQVAVPQVLESLLRKPVKHVSELGPCHCSPGICQAPVIMGQRAMCLRNIGSKP